MELRLPYIAPVTIRCTYPLHPHDNYHGIGWIRWKYHIPADVVIVVRPEWPADTLGTWWWCPRCTRRNAQRTTLAHQIAESTYRRHKHYGFNAIRKVGSRFVTLHGQSLFAKRHAPPGMAWCSWYLHYAPIAGFRWNHEHRRDVCQDCWRLQVKRQTHRKWWGTHQIRQAVRHEVETLRSERAQLKREMATLKRQKDQLEQAVLTERLPMPDAEEAWEAPAVVAPAPPVRVARASRSSSSRRKAFAT